MAFPFKVHIYNLIFGEQFTKKRNVLSSILNIDFSKYRHRHRDFDDVMEEKSEVMLIFIVLSTCPGKPS